MSASPATETADQRIGILPGQTVSSFAVPLPPLPTGKLARALPHIMADYLADERADTAFCVLEQNAQGASLVLACDTAILRETITRAAENKTNLTALWPDYMRLAVPESGVAVLQDGDDIMARRADGTGFRLPKTMADKVLSDETTCDGQEAGFPPDNAGFAIGRFGPNLPIGALVKKSRRSLALLLATAVAWSGSLLFQAQRNENQRDALEAEAVALYQARFPEARRIVNVEAQLRSKLGQSGNRQGFTGMFAGVRQIISAQTGARLEGFSYTAKPSPAFKMVVATPGFSELEQLRAGLSEAGFQLNGGSSEQIDGLILTEMTLSQGGGR